MSSFPPLPSNRLILNGHKIHSVTDLLSYLNKRLQTTLFQTPVDFQELLNHYPGLTIAIRHGDTFLQDESPETQIKILQLLSQQ